MGCKLDYIIINNKKVNLQKTDYLLTFNADNVRLLAPKKFIDVYSMSYLKKEFQKEFVGTPLQLPKILNVTAKRLRKLEM